MTTPGAVGPGHRVAGRYRLLSRIGGGGMGVVWLATDERLGRDVAVKQVVLPVGVSPEVAQEQRARVMREGRIAARLSHPHAIAVYDVADDGGSPWLVMEHLPSRSLADVLSSAGVLPVHQVAQIGAQLADALVATHAAGIVHRDVKPGNVLVGQGGRVEGLVKITDFGISHAAGDVRLTQTGMVTGTPAFLSPEVARGHEPGAASDVWSLGATLFTACEGDPPFGSSGNSLELLHRVAAGVADPPTRSGALTGPLQRMLTADPDQRPTMAWVRDELARVAAGADGDTTAVLTARTPLQTMPVTALRPRTRTDLPVPPVPPPVSSQARPVDPPPSSSQARPVGPPPSSSQARPVGPPPVSSQVRPQVRPTVAPRRRQRGPLLAVLGVLLLAGVALGAVWLSTREGADGTSASPTTSQAPGTTQESAPTPDPTTDVAPPTTEAPPPTDDVLTAAEVTAAIEGYYALLPQDPQTAYGLTGPQLQAAENRGNYIAFWNRFESVALGPVSATDGSLEATAQVTYVEDGEQLVEQHRFTLVEGADGTLLMDLDVAE